MQTRALGNSGLSVVPFCLGGNVFGWNIDQSTSFAVLDAALHHGLTFIDTADVYSRWGTGNQGGESETILGAWFRHSGARQQIVLATKVGMDMGDGKQGLRKAYILQAVEASLQRLGTDYIDLYQSHKDDESTPLDETLEAYQQLIEQGKVRAIGASNYTGARLAEALQTATENGLPAYTALQPNYNLIDREQYEGDLAPVVATYNLGVIPYYSLASGFLTGKYRSAADTEGRIRGSRVTKYFNDRGSRILQALDEISSQTGVKQAAVALAWLAAQPNITAPIASATSVDQLEDLAVASTLQLSPQQLEVLTTASAY